MNKDFKDSKKVYIALSIFCSLLFTIWLVGKSYSPDISNAADYHGEFFERSEKNQLVKAKGIVTKSWTNSQGMTFLKVKGTEGEFGVSFFPSLGNLPFIPREGDFISVIGILDRYKGKPQIYPLAASSVEQYKEEPKVSPLTTTSPLVLQSQDPVQESLQFPSVTVGQLEDYLTQLVWLKNMRCLSIEKFTSKKGKKMLRFELFDPSNQSVKGIFFEGDWDESTYQKLRSQNQFNILVEVSTFQGEISLIGKRLN